MGCCLDRKGWWFDWYFGIGFVVEVGNLIMLEKVFYDFVCWFRFRVLIVLWLEFVYVCFV